MSASVWFFFVISWILIWRSVAANIILWYRRAVLNCVKLYTTNVKDIHIMSSMIFNGQLQPRLLAFLGYATLATIKANNENYELSSQTRSILFLVLRPIHAYVPNAWCHHLLSMKCFECLDMLMMYWDTSLFQGLLQNLTKRKIFLEEQAAGGHFPLMKSCVCRFAFWEVQCTLSNACWLGF